MSNSEAATKAARTRKRRAAAAKAALTRKRRTAGRKATLTKSRRAAGRKAASTKARRLVLTRIQAHLHELIRIRARERGIRIPEDLPVLSHVVSEVKTWFPVPGMMGGFAYNWDLGSPEPLLVVESWSRAVEGSGQRHHVTAARSVLVAEGFA